MTYLNIKQLGKLARKLREQASLSQVEAAQIIGSCQSNVSAAEQGKSSRYANVAIKLVQIIGQKSVTGPFFYVQDSLDD
ncbi:MAG: helix-turn-helix domain-containing protein [Desmonostoc vinosum HA7617-LM4]|jgi:predicted transcriptional regulator|nr:helix-turn-helix domain-containing protein [Desmonostoc vinosum HA7617-LM4]